MKAHDSIFLSTVGARWNWTTVGCWAVALCCLLVVSPARAQIVINEVLANNKTVAASLDNPDYFPDYVELYNTSGASVDLGAGGWRLGDSGTNFAFAVGTIIPAHSNLVVYCDSDTTVPGVHTGFGLNATEGDTVYLYRNSAVSELVTLGIQAADYSLGRVPDGTGSVQLTLPTPGDTNVSVALGNPFVLKINEWLATNSAGADKDWFEIYNPDSNAIALTGLVFADRGSSNIVSFLRPTPANSYIAPFGFVQIHASGKANDADEVDFSLSSTLGDDIWIFASNSATGVIDHISFLGGQQRNESEGRLPDGGAYQDQAGNNLKLKSLSPGDSNFGSLPEIVINEFLAHVDPPLEDTIELYNPTTTNVSVGGWWLSNNRNNPKKYQIPAGTIVPAGGYFVFYEYQFNGPSALEPFNLNSAHGGELFLFKADAAGDLLGFRRGVTFDASENGVSFGRWVNSQTNVDIVPMASLTFGTSITRLDDPSLTNAFRTGQGATNSYPKVGPVVINEIHYHPTNRPGVLTDNSLDEYVELRNLTDQPFALYDTNIYTYQGDIYADGRTNTWHLRGGISYNLPMNVTVAAEGYVLLVNFDPETNATQLLEFTNKFQISGYPATVAIVGPYKGKLSNGGASLTLLKPDPPQGPPLHLDELGFVPYTMADYVKYNDKAPWPPSNSTNSIGPDGFGQSLQRLVPSDYGNEPLNWIGANPTPGLPNGPAGLATPVITADPSPVSTIDGAAVSFTVEATGTNLFYRWQYNGVQISWATNATLVLENVATNQVGNYRAMVINAAGTAYSAPAALEVLDSGSVTNDHTAPTVAFVSPQSGSQVSTPDINVRGTAADNLVVAFVELSLNGGEFFRTTGKRTWSADLTLNPGLNTLRARATDLNGNQSEVVSRSVTYTTNTVNLIIQGQGTVKGLTSTTPLEIGRDYTIKAVPSRDHVFLRWAGDVSSTSPNLTFRMATGLDIVAVFITNPFGGGVAGNYNGLFYEGAPHGVRHESAGSFTLTLTKNGAYSARVFLAGKTYPCRGTLDLGGFGSNTIVRPALPPIQVRWQVDVESGSDTLAGSMFTETWTNSIAGDRATFHVLYNRAGHGGRYTFALPGVPGSTNQPEGDSVGAIQVGSNGRVLMAGTLADNTRFAQDTWLSRSGSIPLHVSLYHGQGLLLGWINLGPIAPTNRFSGTLSWIKPGGITGDRAALAYYPNGFTNDASIIGSKYVAPVFTNEVLRARQAQLTLAGVEFDPALTYIVDLLLGGQVSFSGVDRLTFQVAKPTGLFSGALQRSGEKTQTRFNGVFLQSSTNAFGFVLGTNRIGRLTMEADR